MTAKPGPDDPDGHLGPTRVRDLVLLGADVEVGPLGEAEPVVFPVALRPGLVDRGFAGDV